MQLTAVVVGAGWAGEGHTRTLQQCGVEVVAICARQLDVVRAVADRLRVREASVDWRATIEAVRPNIVALATPASVRGEVVDLAVRLGCHVFSDKPLALDAKEAHRLYEAMQASGLKHAYATTHRYDPSVAWLAELVRDGAIGRLHDASMAQRTGIRSGVRPWSWCSRLETGGGALYNGMPHVLGILETVVGGEMARVMGFARAEADRAPVVPGIHDFRDWLSPQRAMTDQEAEGLEWRPCDADAGFSALMQLVSPAGQVSVSAIQGPGVGDVPEGLRFFGTSGTLIANGLWTYEVSRIRAAGETPEPLPVPQRLLDTLPRIGDDFENKWMALAQDFVADVRGEPHRPYLTFRDGWRYQEAIDAIRRGGWYELPAESHASPRADSGFRG